MFVSNHTSHLDATMIDDDAARRVEETAPSAPRRTTSSTSGGAGVHRARVRRVPDRPDGGGSEPSMARELVQDGWSLVVFPEGARSPDGRTGSGSVTARRGSRWSSASGRADQIRGAYRRCRRGRNWPRPGRLCRSAYGRDADGPARERDAPGSFAADERWRSPSCSTGTATTWWVALHRGRARGDAVILRAAGGAWLPQVGRFRTEPAAGDAGGPGRSAAPAGRNARPP